MKNGLILLKWIIFVLLITLLIHPVPGTPVYLYRLTDNSDSELSLDFDTDSTGGIHAAYVIGSSVYYMRPDGEREIIGTGSAPQIAVGTDNIPQIVYVSGSDVVYSTRISGSWSSPEVVSASANYPAIALDSGNNPHISVSNNIDTSDSYTEIAYYHRVGSSFSGELIFDGWYYYESGNRAANYFEGGSEIKIDSEGNYHIIAPVHDLNGYLGGTDHSYGMVYKTNKNSGASYNSGIIYNQQVRFGLDSLALPSDVPKFTYIQSGNINEAIVSTGSGITVTAMITAGSNPTTSSGTAGYGISYLNASSYLIYTPITGSGYGTSTVIDGPVIQNVLNLKNKETILYLKSDGSDNEIWLASDKAIPPKITGIEPCWGYNNGSVSITNLSGSNFQDGAEINLTKSGKPNITAIGSTFISSSKYTCTLPLSGAEAGQWNIVITNSDGQAGTLNNGFTITDPIIPPVADFSINPDSGTAPLTVQFTDTSSGGTPTEWDWNYGDGSAWFNTTDSSQKNHQHTYSSAGTYSATLVVKNSAGENAISKQIMVSAPIVPPVADFMANPGSGIAPLTVLFIDISTGGAPTEWDWNYGDGSAWFNTTDSAQKNPGHTYTSAGTFTTTLVVKNSVGQSTATRQIIVTISVVAPVASFTTSTSSGTAPLTVRFTDTSTGSPTSWSWTFGDGGTSTEQNPIHTYTSAGTFSATLVVKNTAGQSTSNSVITVKSTNIPIVPKITSITPTSGQQGGKAAVTITGTYFEKNEVKVTVSGKGVIVGAYKTRNTNKIIVPFTIAKTAKTGVRTVTVTNPSSSLKATKPFSVITSPKITKISPILGKQSKTVKVTITGKNFEKGKSTISISGTKVSVTKYVTRNTDKIVAMVKIASGAASTKRTITLKNPTWGVTATAPVKFTVLKAKGIDTSQMEPGAVIPNGVLSSTVLSSSSLASPLKSPPQSKTGLVPVIPPDAVKGE